MATHLKIKSDRGIEIHFDGVFDDHTLCGLSTSLDERLGIKSVKKVNAKVNCEDCIKFVKYCQSIDKKDFK